MGAKYCSRICQKKEWPEHKGVCEHARSVIVMVGESIEVIDTKIERFRTLAEEGEEGAQCSLGMCFLLGMGISRDKQEALKWLQRAAEAGCCEAMFCLGTSYYFGNYGIMANKKEGLKWHKRAADAGFKLSIEALKEIAVLVDERETRSARASAELARLFIPMPANVRDALFSAPFGTL
jgi:TPR repeat protein